MEVKKDVDVLIKGVAACNTLTAEEDFALTKAVQDKGTDCDEMKKLHEVYDRFVVSIAKQSSSSSPMQSGGFDSPCL